MRQAFSFHMPSRQAWLLAALVLLVVGLRLHQLPGYPYHEDEAGSIAVVRSIAETGLPLAENSTLYWRSLLSHYLMAMPVYFSGISLVSTRLVSVLFSGLMLPVVYAMGRRAQGSVAGWLAAGFLGFSAYENLYASMARFYLPFQFFFVAAVYWAGEYFIRSRSGSGKWLLLSTFGAIATHEFAAELLLVFLLAVLIGKNGRMLREKAFWWSVLAVAALGYILLIYRPESGFVNYTAIPLSLSEIPDKAVFYQWFRRLTPLATTLLILALYPIFCERMRELVFYLLTFVLGVLFLTTLAPGDNPRYLCNIYPLGVVAAVSSLAWWGRSLLGPLTQRKGFGPMRHPLFLCLVLGLAMGHLIFLENLNIGKAFGNNFRFVDQAPAHEFIRQRLLYGDLVITTEPDLTKLLLGMSADYYLREKYDKKTRTYSTFSPEEAASQTLPLLDSPEKLLQVLDEHSNRIWLYANWKILKTVSIETDRLIRERFIPMYSQKQTYVLLRK